MINQIFVSSRKNKGNLQSSGLPLNPLKGTMLQLLKVPFRGLRGKPKDNLPSFFESLKIFFLKAVSKLSLLICVIFFVITQGYSQKIELSINLKKGDEFSYKIENKTITIQTIMGTEQVILNTEETEYDFVVKELNQNSEYIIEVEYKRVRLFSEAESIKMDFDSAEPADSINPFTAFLSALPGKSFTITVTPYGDVKEVRGPDRIVKDISDSIKLDEGTQKALLVRYGTDQLHSYFKSCFCNYPEKKIKPGLTWAKINNELHGFSYVIDNLWKLNKIESDTAFLVFEGEIKSDKEKPVKISNVKLYYDLKGNQIGHASVNKNTGLVINSNIKQNFAGTICVKGMNIPESYKWSIEIEKTTKIIKQ